MKKLIIPVAAIAMLAACSDTGADKDGDGKISTEEVAAEMDNVKLKPGEWETTMELIDVKLDGLPEGAPDNMAEMMKSQGKQTTKSCLTQEDVDKIGADFFAGPQAANCEVKEFNMAGGKVNSSMSCKPPQGTGEMNMTVSGDYGETSYDMTMNMKSEGLPGGMSMDMEAQLTSKRLGDCPQ